MIPGAGGFQDVRERVPTQGSLRTRGPVIVLRAAMGKQNDEREDSQGRAEWRVEDEHDPENDGGDTGPGLVVHQAVADEDRAQTEHHEAASEQEREGAKGKEGAVIMPTGVETVTDTHGHDGRNQGKKAHNHPKHGQDVEAALIAGDVGNWSRRSRDADDGFAASTAEVGGGIELGSAVIAEHIFLPEALTFSTQRAGQMFRTNRSPVNT